MTSELQGNVTDLCPVGALPPKPQNFRARPWEYQKTETIDVQDALGSAIRVDARGREVIRILPRLNEAVNEEWISDKTRQVVDGLKAQRLDRPYIRENGRLRPPPGRRRSPPSPPRRRRRGREDRRAGRRSRRARGDHCAEAARRGPRQRQSRRAQDGQLDPRFGRASYLFNATIAGIDDADSLLIIGSDPRKEAPVLNARIRKRWLKGDFPDLGDRRAGRPHL